MIFLDVGAHNGQTLEEVTKPKWPFRHVYAFEPMHREYEAITRFHSPSCTVLNYGLADFTGTAPIYGSNDHCEASMFPEKVDVDNSVETICRFVRATHFMQTMPDEPIIMKMNCEGAEIAILNDLLDSHRIDRISHLTVDFDIRRVPGKELWADQLIGRLNETPLEWRLSGDHFHGETHQLKIENWLTEIL